MNPCLISPFLFLTNTVISYIYGYVFYAFLFAQLLLTSLYYHGVGDWVSTVLDRSAVLALIGYGGYMFATKLTAGDYRSSLAALVVATFLLSGYLYFYGRQEGAYCFDADPAIANSWHAGLHAVSALGHICIVLL